MCVDRSLRRYIVAIFDVHTRHKSSYNLFKKYIFFSEAKMMNLKFKVSHYGIYIHIKYSDFVWNNKSTIKRYIKTKGGEMCET